MGTTNKTPPPAFDIETLAIFLAVGGQEDSAVHRSELIEAWEEKEESVQEAYRRRARRLMKTWRTP